MPLFFLSSLVIAIDQLVKYIMLKILVYGNSIPIIKGFFSLTLVYNTGAAFGILQGKQGLFLVLPVLTIGFILVLYMKSRNRNGLLMPLGLLLGGTAGNFIDRIRFGYVVDFFDLYFHSWHWPAFNIADTCICSGVLLFFVQTMRRKDAPGFN